MPLILVVKSSDAAVKTKREGTAQRVIAEFGDQLPNLKLLCFFDDVDWLPLRDAIGKANRGFYRPLSPSSQFWNWPDDVMEHLFIVDPPSWIQKLAFDHVIYLHGSTCSDEVGLSMTLAHELQHFVQWSRTPQVYAAGILVLQLLAYWPQETAAALGLKSWADIPHERDVRIVAKRVVAKIFGQEGTARFIDGKIANPVDETDGADWRFIQAIGLLDTYDVSFETNRLFQRFEPYRRDCEEVLRNTFEYIPELKHLDLDRLFRTWG